MEHFPGGSFYQLKALVVGVLMPSGLKNYLMKTSICLNFFLVNTTRSRLVLNRPTLDVSIPKLE